MGYLRPYSYFLKTSKFPMLLNYYFDTHIYLSCYFLVTYIFNLFHRKKYSMMWVEVSLTTHGKVLMPPFLHMGKPDRANPGPSLVMDQIKE